MEDRQVSAKVNIRLLAILAVAIVVVGTGAVSGHFVRKRAIARDALTAGRAALEQRDWPTACKQLRRYLEKYPDDVEVLREYGAAQLSIHPLEVENIGAAIGAYRRLIRIAPEDELAYQRLAGLYSVTGNYSELAYIARKRIGEVAEDRKAPLWLAKALMAEHKPEEAVEVLSDFIERLEDRDELLPEYGEACVLLSVLAGAAEDAAAWDNARHWLDVAVEYDPDMPVVLVARARFFRLTAASRPATADDNLAQAVADLEHAAELEPRDLRVRLQLGEEWLAHGRYARVADQLKALAAVVPADVQEYFIDTDDFLAFRFNLAAASILQRGAAAEAVELADQTFAPRDPEHAALRGDRHRARTLATGVRLYLLGGDVEDAEACLKEYTQLVSGTQLSPDDESRIALLRATIAQTRGRPYETIDALSPIVMRDSSNIGAVRLLAEALSQTRQSRRAIRALSQCLRQHPDDLGLTFQLLREYVGRGDWASAFTVARRAPFLYPPGVREASAGTLAEGLSRLRKTRPKSVEIRLLQAIVAASSGRMDDAEAELRNAIGECDEKLLPQLQLIRFCYATDRSEEAIKIAGAACEQYPEVAEPWLARSDLERRSGRVDEARRTLQAAMKSVRGYWEQQDIVVALARLELLHADRQEAIDLLRRFVTDNPADAICRSLLLNLPETKADPAAAQRLIDEMRGIEGDGGLTWRVHQAALWLAGNDWRDQQDKIIESLTFCIDADPGWPPPALLLGRMYERLGHSDRAESVYHQALSADPDAVEVAERLLALYRSQGRFAEARDTLDRLESKSRLSPERRVALWIGARDWDKAIEELELKVANDPQDAGARVMLARLVYQQTGDAERPLRLLDEAESLAGASSAVVAARVAILRPEGRLEEARRIVDAYVGREPSFEAYMLRASFLDAVGENELAEQDYRKLTTFAKGGDGWVLLGSFFVRTKRLDEAIDAWERGLELFPEHPRLKRRLMTALFMRGGSTDRQRALAMLDELEQENRDDPELLWVNTLYKLEQNDPAETAAAEQLLGRIIQINPAAIDAYLKLIELDLNRGDFTSARDLAVRAQGIAPDNEQVLLARAASERALNNPDLAAKLVRLALDRDGNNPDAVGLLARLSLDNRDPDMLAEAQSLLEKVVVDNPDSEDLHLVLASVLHARGLTSSAIKFLDAFSRTHPDSASVGVQLALARLCRSRGDAAAAERWTRAAVARQPDNPQVLIARIHQLSSRQRFNEIQKIVADFAATHTRDVKVRLASASALAASAETDDRAVAKQLFEQVAALSPHAWDARVMLGTLAYEAGDLDTAESIYRSVLGEQPGHVGALNNLAWILAIRNTGGQAAIEEARDLIDRALAQEPGNIRCLGTQALILSHLPDPDAGIDACDTLIRAALATHDASALAEARETLEQLVAPGSEDDRPFLMLARVLEASGQPEAAITLLDTRYQARPDSVDVAIPLALSRLCLNQNDPETADQWLRVASTRDPDNPDVFVSHIRQLSRQQRFDEIEKVASEYLSRQPDNVAVLTAAASALAESTVPRHRAAAKTLFEHVVATAPHPSDAQVGLGLLACQAGRLDEAEKEFHAVLAENPNNAAALNNLAWVLATVAGDDPAALDEALGLVSRAIDQAPDNPHYRDTRAAILARLPNRLCDARADYEWCRNAAREMSPQRARASLELARICVELDEFSDARRYLDELRRIDQDRGVLTPAQRRTLGELVQSIGSDEATRVSP